MMSLSPLAKMLIAAAWAGLSALMASLGVPVIVIQAIAAVLTQLGLLGAAELTHEEMTKRASALHAHLEQK